ncbi:hypothetical protein [Chengkuizengella marina]|uniref:Uncharacterized protein n=1 Tax=Chengkuizengella marina TaxID=2507566 RepID=A0A6N9PW60_9BACL|nr:hypothetical protein [Chengkuizengella marina]NBI27761.1 hypothetical protein [Chengkuizengella marina]
MKSGKFLVTTLILILMFAIGAGSLIADQNYFSFEEPSNETERQIKEKIDNANKKYKNDVDNDIKNTHNINLKSYDLINIDQILDDNSEEYNVFIEIMQKQTPGDTLPSLYVKGKKGYIFEKKSDGTNLVYTLEKNGAKWEMKDKKEKKGKKIDHPLNNS